MRPSRSRPGSAGHRSRRVAEVIREIVAEFLATGAKDPRIGFVTVTRVDVTGDLGRAVIRYRAHGDDTAKETTAQGLAAAASAVRREIGRQMKLRIVPEIAFEHDAGAEHASRIEELLAQIKKDEVPPAE